MARIRSVKPELFLDEDLGTLTGDHLTLFVGLLTQADREGRLEHRPVRLKAALFPYRQVDVDALLADLQRAKKVVLYEADGVRCISIPGFRKHQRPHPHEPQSILPPPPDEPSRDMSRQEMTSVDTGREEGKGKEDKGREGKVAEPFELQQQQAEKKQRSQSTQEKFATWFASERKIILGDDWVEDLSLSVRRLNKELGWVGAKPPEVVAEAARLYLDDPYRRGQKPPCSILWFSRDRANYLSRAEAGE